MPNLVSCVTGCLLRNGPSSCATGRPDVLSMLCSLFILYQDGHQKSKPEDMFESNCCVTVICCLSVKLGL